MTKILRLYTAFLKNSNHASNVHQTGIISQLDSFLQSCKRPTNNLWEIIKRTKSIGKKGIYLHGSVGSGKTMLMDLFNVAATSENICTKRIHYNEFMLDIHSSNAKNSQLRNT